MAHKNFTKNLGLAFLAFIFSWLMAESQSQGKKPVSVAIFRMTHDHVGFILDRLKSNYSDLKLTGVYEPNHELVERYSKIYNLDPSLFYDNFEKLLDRVKPEAVLAFGSIFDHLTVVEACAPRGIHVMVEKPLAVNMDHANKMKALADKYKIHLLTDFETSWYPSTAKSWQLVNDSNYVGTLRRVVIHDGHEGPVEIGCSSEFLAWLTDPVQNGGGAITDFGCYGANLMTFLTKGQQPISVTAVTRQFKPSIYPKVDDDATIIVSYPTSGCIIQASWNWPFGRKDMEIYGENGYIMADNKNEMRIKNRTRANELKRKVTADNIEVYEDPFSYFANVIRNNIMMKNYDPYSIENNMIVVKILDAARESAKTGTTVKYK
ncbi:MAG: Gfo/Idh/MocA family oxidoreductase [Bacteroidia bacterium]|nr:Gfo/Idh/MocA family oxidoreductase [Bacteroidia bacterium]